MKINFIINEILNLFKINRFEKIIKSYLICYLYDNRLLYLYIRIIKYYLMNLY